MTVGQWFVQLWLGIQVGITVGYVASLTMLPLWSVAGIAIGAAMMGTGLVGMAFGKR